MRTYLGSFVSGCAMDRATLFKEGELKYDIFRIQNKLYARCKEGDHKTVSSDLKPHNLWKEIVVHWREYQDSLGHGWMECPAPRGKRQKRLLKNAKISRTLLLRSQLKNAGIL